MIVVTSPEHLRAAFAEWERRAKERPEEFAGYEAGGYADAAADYFLHLLAEVMGADLPEVGYPAPDDGHRGKKQRKYRGRQKPI